MAAALFGPAAQILRDADSHPDIDVVLAGPLLTTA
jgi:hypothetical protein